MLKRGFIGSGSLHLTIIAAASFAWPHSFQLPEDESPVRRRLVTVADRPISLRRSKSRPRRGAGSAADPGPGAEPPPPAGRPPEPSRSRPAAKEGEGGYRSAATASAAAQAGA